MQFGTDRSQERSPDQEAQHAIDLLESLRNQLTSAANSAGGGDDARYYVTYEELEPVLNRLGVANPFPWPNLREGVEAAKSEHSGPGSYGRRRDYFKNRAEPALVALRRRVADHEAGNLAAGLAALQVTAGGALADIAWLRQELARIEGALPEDPSVAIGKAKNLVEATAKAVLTELKEPVDEKEDVRPLASAAARALALIPDSAPAPQDREAAKIVSRTLGIVEEITNLRNSAGDGHGTATLPEGLDARHGRLAVRAAILWCTFMLDTLADHQTDQQS